MRVLHKIVLNLIIVVTFFILFYVFVTSESSSDNRYPSTFDNSCYTSTGRSNVFETSQNDFHRRPSTIEIVTDFETKIEANDVYNIWCIFTKVTRHAPMKHKFYTFTHSLLSYSSGHVALHIIIDNSSRAIADEVLQNVKETTQKDVLVIQSLFSFFLLLLALQFLLNLSLIQNCPPLFSTLRLSSPVPRAHVLYIFLDRLKLPQFMFSNTLSDFWFK